MAMGEALHVLGTFIVRDIFYFPVWWYSRGILYVGQQVRLSARRQAAFFAVGLWAKNLFVPMYGQYDWQGRIISFFIRLAQILFRSLGLSVWIVLLCFFGVAYLFLPIVLIFFIALHFPFSF